MPLPLSPLAVTALRTGAVVAAGWYLKRRTRTAPKGAWQEAALDETPEGVDLTTDRSGDEANAHGSARLTRTVRLFGGQGLEIDIATLARFRVRRV